MFHRDRPENEYTPLYKRFDLGTMVWSPLASGILTGKYNDGIPADSRFAQHYDTFKKTVDGLTSEEGVKKLDKVRALSKLAESELGCSITHLALAWVAKHRTTSTVILGASKPEQVLDNLNALHVIPKLTADILGRIEEILDNKPVPASAYAGEDDTDRMRPERNGDFEGLRSMMCCEDDTKTSGDQLKKRREWTRWTRCFFALYSELAEMSHNLSNLQVCSPTSSILHFIVHISVHPISAAPPRRSVPSSRTENESVPHVRNRLSQARGDHAPHQRRETSVEKRNHNPNQNRGSLCSYRSLGPTQEYTFPWSLLKSLSDFMVVVEATDEHVLTVRSMSDTRPSITSTDTTDLDDRKDVEQSPKSSELSDPYAFRNGILTEDELAILRKRKRGKAIERYHRRQNDLISALLKPMEEHTEDARAAEEAARLPIKIAIWASLVANFCLCVIQLYAAISSLSLSLLATGIDSVFDIGSNVLLLWVHRTADKLDMNKWPVGGARLETIGNIVYGFLMSAVNLVVIVESMRTIITHNSAKDTNALHVPSLIAVAAALGNHLDFPPGVGQLTRVLGVKLVLFFYCMGFRKSSSQVEVLWEDHRNDLFINGFGLLMSAGGSKLKWYLDPMGAIIIATGVILAWGRTIYRQFELLAGKSAPHDFLQLLIYKTMTFSNDIDQVDTVRAYHSGPSYYVEIDIVMDANTPLWKAHDTSQQLQDKIEVLPNVGRAFVHVDHETTHTPEHRKNL
ncbi:hypothetical protein NM688_g8066 [Phlebia brevispora]|uniref:Uncharacterized protein n=1 Tax=Phlebia brevispora TaxID=194682 RepID=A0ACC1RXR6_9APHY|nr:hypothetical protein NM688_g8066 [Phlebia brevispora]